MPCNKRSEEAATATKYRKKGWLWHVEDFIPLQVLIYFNRSYTNVLYLSIMVQN